MSYRQLHSSKPSDKGIDPSHTLYLACCGALSQTIREELSEVFEQAKQQHQTVILALDKDQAGKDMTKQLEALLQEKHCSYQVKLPTLGKDWNQALELTAFNEQQRQQEEQKNELTRLEATHPCQHIVITQTPLEALYLKQERLDQIKDLQEQIEHARDAEKPLLEEQLLDKKHAYNSSMYVSLPKEIDEKSHHQLETSLRTLNSKASRLL